MSSTYQQRLRAKERKIQEALAMDDIRMYIKPLLIALPEIKSKIARKQPTRRMKAQRNWLQGKSLILLPISPYVVTRKIIEKVFYHFKYKTESAWWNDMMRVITIDYKSSKLGALENETTRFIIHRELADVYDMPVVFCPTEELTIIKKIRKKVEA